MQIEARELLGDSPGIVELRNKIGLIANSDYPVLIKGETGSGKELVARHIHSNCRDRTTFVPINMANLQETLADSELFGSSKGSFTGANEDRVGLIEHARAGTVFFDEVADCSVFIQAKLLRLIDNREFRRIGDNRIIRSDARFIFATNRNLVELIKQGTFRKDLYYRISIIEIDIPPLRNRKKDIPILAESLVRLESAKEGRTKRISNEAVEKLCNYDYPGNVRELESIIKRAFIMGSSALISADDIAFSGCGHIENQPPIMCIYEQLIRAKGSYWDIVHKPFIRRELKLSEVRALILMGLRETKGSIKKLAVLFNIRNEAREYKKFWDTIKNHKLKD